MPNIVVDTVDWYEDEEGNRLRASVWTAIHEGDGGVIWCNGTTHRVITPIVFWDGERHQSKPSGRHPSKIDTADQVGHYDFACNCEEPCPTSR